MTRLYSVEVEGVTEILDIELPYQPEEGETPYYLTPLGKEEADRLAAENRSSNVIPPRRLARRG